MSCRRQSNRVVSSSAMLQILSGLTYGALCSQCCDTKGLNISKTGSIRSGTEDLISLWVRIQNSVQELIAYRKLADHEEETSEEL